MLHLQATESFTAKMEKLLNSSSTLNDNETEIIRDDLFKNRVSIQTLKLILQLQQQQQQEEEESNAPSVGDLLRGSKLKFTGFNNTTSSEASINKYFLPGSCHGMINS